MHGIVCPHPPFVCEILLLASKIRYKTDNNHKVRHTNNIIVAWFKTPLNLLLDDGTLFMYIHLILFFDNAI